MRAIKDKPENHQEEEAQNGVLISTTELKSVCKVLTLVSMAESANAYCTNYEGIHGPSLWRDVQDTSTHNDGVCGIFQVPSTKGYNIPMVVSYNEGLVGNLAQRILQCLP